MMLKTITLSILLVSFLFSCHPVKTVPNNYAEKQDKARHQMIAIFFDGTRDRLHSKKWRNSHVRTTHDLAYPSIKTLYVEGVGAGPYVKDALGAYTTNQRVMRAYRFLVENYKTGDSICLFGFSRGANQCRILSSLVYTIGVINLKQINGDAAKENLMMRLYSQYLDTTGYSAKKYRLATFLRNEGLRPEHYDTSGTLKIELIALWDTVEALEINDAYEDPTPIPQHLNQLYNVKKIYHAVSLDNNRAFNYTPILANHNEVALGADQNVNLIVEEVWFNGSHKDVGGGVRFKKNDNLSGISLKWMSSRVDAYRIFRKPSYTVNPYGIANDMRKNLIARKTSPSDTLRGIDKYWAAMHPQWNSHRIKIHQSVIDRLEAGVLQDFKTKNGRLDWYDWEPFRQCFTKTMANGKTSVIFNKACSCIEVVNDCM